MIKKEKTIYGQLHPTWGLPLITVDIINLNTDKKVENLRAFIDTGASETAINRNSLIQLGMREEDFKAGKKMNTHTGEIQVSRAFDVHLISKELDFYFQTIPYVLVVDIPDFDIAIGNDVLQNCEFTYNGINKTYSLKSFQEEPSFCE